MSTVCRCQLSHGILELTAPFLMWFPGSQLFHFVLEAGEWALWLKSVQPLLSFRLSWWLSSQDWTEKRAWWGTASLGLRVSSGWLLGSTPAARCHDGDDDESNNRIHSHEATYWWHLLLIGQNYCSCFAAGKWRTLALKGNLISYYTGKITG